MAKKSKIDSNSKKERRKKATEELEDALNYVAKVKYQDGERGAGMRRLLRHLVSRAYNSDASLKVLVDRVLPSLQEIDTNKSDVYDLVTQIRNTYQTNFVKAIPSNELSKDKAEGNRLT